MFSLLVNQTRSDANSLGIKFIYGTPNSQSQPGYEKYAGFRRIPEIRVHAVYLPVHVQRALRKHLPAGVAALVGAGWRAVLRSGLRLRTLMTRRDWDLEDAARVPEDWPAFWEEVRVSRDFMISREAEYLQWRYFQGPYEYRMLVARRTGRIRAYLIYRLVDDPRMPSIRIADCLALPGETSTLGGLLEHVLGAALDLGAVQVSAWCPSGDWQRDVFRSMGFITDGEIPVICHDNEVARSIRQRCRTWHFSIGDSDNV
jgi:hypothetical protein